MAGTVITVTGYLLVPEPLIDSMLLTSRGRERKRFCRGGAIGILACHDIGPSIDDCRGDRRW